METDLHAGRLSQYLSSHYPQVPEQLIKDLVAQRGNNPSDCIAYLENKLKSAENPVFAPPDESYYPWNRTGSGRGINPGRVANPGRGSYVIRRGKASSRGGPPLSAQHLRQQDSRSVSDDESRHNSIDSPDEHPHPAVTFKIPAQATRAGSPLAIQVAHSSSATSFHLGIPRRQSVGSPLAQGGTSLRMAHSATTGHMAPLSINTRDYPHDEFHSQPTVFDTPSPSTPGSSDFLHPSGIGRNFRISISPSRPHVEKPRSILDRSERLKLQTESRDRLKVAVQSSVDRLEELRSDVSQMELPPFLLSSLSSGNVTRERLQTVHVETRQLQAEVNAMLKRLQAASEPKKPPEGSWNCSACTFLNHPEIQQCEMCQLPRVHILPGPSSSTQRFHRKSSFRCYCCESGNHVETVSEDGWEVVPRLGGPDPVP